MDFRQNLWLYVKSIAKGKIAYYIFSYKTKTQLTIELHLLFSYNHIYLLPAHSFFNLFHLSLFLAFTNI